MATDPKQIMSSLTLYEADTFQDLLIPGGEFVAERLVVHAVARAGAGLRSAAWPRQRQRNPRWVSVIVKRRDGS